jgi:hypothetical protein
VERLWKTVSKGKRERGIIKNEEENRGVGQHRVK